MKKIFVLAVVVVSQMGGVQAYSESRDGLGKSNPLAPLIQKKIQQKYDDAVWTRYKNYFTGKVRSTEDRNLDLQKAVHNDSKKNNNISGGSATTMNRTGVLQSVPYYAEQRPVTISSGYANNSKNNFRKRAINYYVDGGYADASSITDDVVYGSEHEVRKFIGRKYGWLVGSIISPLRDVQRNLSPETNENAPRVESTHKTGSSTRNFMHPFMPTME